MKQESGYENKSISKRQYFGRTKRTGTADWASNADCRLGIKLHTYIHTLLTFPKEAFQRQSKFHLWLAKTSLESKHYLRFHCWRESVHDIIGLWGWGKFLLCLELSWTEWRQIGRCITWRFRRRQQHRGEHIVKFQFVNVWCSVLCIYKIIWCRRIIGVILFVCIFKLVTRPSPKAGAEMGSLCFLFLFLVGVVWLELEFT